MRYRCLEFTLQVVTALKASLDQVLAVGLVQSVPPAVAGGSWVPLIEWREPPATAGGTDRAELNTPLMKSILMFLIAWMAGAESHGGIGGRVPK